MTLSATPPAHALARGGNVEHEWPIWRLVLEGVATLAEIEERWTLADVLDANEALGVFIAARRAAR